MSIATPIAPSEKAEPPLSVALFSAWLPAIVTAAAAPGLIAYYWRLWTLPHYQFFPLALFGAWLLAKSPRRGNEPEPRVDGRVRKGLMSFSLMTLSISVGLEIPWLCLVASLALIATWLYIQGGKLGLSRNVPALIMILTTLRVPFNFDRSLLTSLQNLTTRLAGAVLDIMHVAHATLGNIIELPGKSLFVEEACSGVNSLFSVAACVIFYLLWTKRSPFVWLILLSSAPLWTLTANVVRVVIIVLLYAAWSIEADSGWLHDMLGFASFASSITLVYCTERLMKFYAAVLPPERPRDSSPINTSGSAPVAAAPAADVRSTLKPASPRFVIIVASILVVWQIPLSIGRLRNYTENFRGLNPQELGADYLPAKHGPWSRRQFEVLHRSEGSNFGGHSQIWKYSGGERAIVSFDYPFAGWHELSECYTAQGWTIESRNVIKPTDGRPGYVVMSMAHRPTGRHGRVWFGLFDNTGSSFTPPATDRFEQWQARYTSRVANLTVWGLKDDPDRPSFQTQVFVEAYAPLTALADQEGRALFFAALSKLTSDPQVVGVSTP